MITIHRHRAAPRSWTSALRDLFIPTVLLLVPGAAGCTDRTTATDDASTDTTSDPIATSTEAGSADVEGSGDTTGVGDDSGDSDEPGSESGEPAPEPGTVLWTWSFAGKAARLLEVADDDSMWVTLDSDDDQAELLRLSADAGLLEGHTVEVPAQPSPGGSTSVGFEDLALVDNDPVAVAVFVFDDADGGFDFAETVAQRFGETTWTGPLTSSAATLAGAPGGNLFLNVENVVMRLDAGGASQWETPVEATYSVRALEVMGDDRLASVAGERITGLSFEGAVRWSVDHPLSNPLDGFDAAVSGPDGTLYALAEVIVDPAQLEAEGELWRIAPDGEVLDTTPWPNSAFAIAVDSQGNLVLPTQEEFTVEVGKYSPTLEPLWVVELTDSGLWISDLETDSTGAVLVVADGEVLKLAP